MALKICQKYDEPEFEDKLVKIGNFIKNTKRGPEAPRIIFLSTNLLSRRHKKIDTI